MTGPTAPRRIAMWSGPRNISTAMMRAWGARPDTTVCDEPLYAHYLSVTGHPHPGAAEVMAHHDTDWRRVVDTLLGPAPDGRAIWYQKHMAHHLLPGMPVEWIDGLTNVFLVRSPREMLVSLTKVLPIVTVEETGLPRQVELFERERQRTGITPPVLDARDVLTDPAGMLRRLCERIEIPWSDAMLSWPAGPRATDGIWAKHWYANVERSTGFAPWTPPRGDPPDALTSLLNACLPLYDHLHAHRLTA
ncbi:MAG: hypothetical protein KDA21_09985 [Phycisphaerales bacterium]|nr:hypothetical protein [Phycisphaerales bacterium]